MGKFSLQTFFFYLVFLSALGLYFSFLFLRNHSTMNLVRREIHSFLHDPDYSRKDNFLRVDNSIYADLVVNTTSCKIPNFNEFDGMADQFAHKAEWIEDCKKISYEWSYRRGNAIVFDSKAIEGDGYSFEQLSCCYTTVSRNQEAGDSHHAENDVIYGSECIEMELETQIVDSEFIMVQCSRKMLGIAGLPIYRVFHAVPNANKIKELKALWNGTKEIPPNVLVIGLDTTSRLNFRRNMPQTREVLEGLNAVEMMGYTKIGEHTRNAMAVMLTGYKTEELDETCHAGGDVPYDNCPFIMKRFKRAGYFTGNAEDWPDLYAFGGSAFVKQPYDYYIRALMNAAHDYGLPFPVNKFVRLSTQWCIGPWTNDEVLIDYIEALAEISHEEKVPSFTFLWSDTIPHSADHNLIQLLDPIYAAFLRRLEAKGLLDNTILFFISDHGQRYGPIRTTLLGFYEDKLPNMWVRLPPAVKEMIPYWEEALKVNSRRLTSTFTFYWTLNKVIDSFRPLTAPPEEAFVNGTEVFPRKVKGFNFFEQIAEEASCPMLGVPVDCCACNPLVQLDLNDPLLRNGAEEALSEVNGKLPEFCEPLRVKNVNGGAAKEELDSGVKDLVIGFITEPGEMQMEVQIQYFQGNGSFSKSTGVQRSNGIKKGDVTCLDLKIPEHKKNEVFCYCKR